MAITAPPHHNRRAPRFIRGTRRFIVRREPPSPRELACRYVENWMKLPRRNFLHLAAGAAALPAVPRVAWAETYPSRPVHMIVGFPPGSAPDIIGRLAGQWLSEQLGQQLVRSEERRV